jgi:hypothetical protein
MRVAIATLLCIHALIHLIGVVKEWQWASVPALSGGTTIKLPATAATAIGALWLATCLALIAAATMLLKSNPQWWLMAAVGIALSQVLVLYAWPDAKTGTLVNAVLVLAVVAGWAHGRFVAESEQLVADLLAGSANAPASVVQPSELTALPEPVRAWLTSAGVVGRPRARNARLKQRGGLRTSVDSDFMPAVAEQYFSVAEPGFVWRVELPMFHIPVLGRDSYIGGHGRMLIKALGLVPIVDARGPEIDQGTLLRFLGEMVCVPSAALEPYVRWEPIDAVSARATMSYAGTSASADFYFNAEHQMERLSARRYLQEGSKPAKLEHWVVRASRWAVLDGTRVPVEGEVTWELATGDFTYYRWQITDLEHDAATAY